LIGIPFESELARRRHIPNERGGRHDGRTGEIAFAAEAHPILPVPIERRDRTLSFLKRVGTLTETRTAPRLSDLAANGSEHIRDRFAAQPRIRPLDLSADAAGPGEDHEILGCMRRALPPRRANDERSREQVVVAA